MTELSLDMHKGKKLSREDVNRLLHEEARKMFHHVTAADHLIWDLFHFNDETEDALAQEGCG